MSYRIRKYKKKAEITFDESLNGSSVKKLIEEFDTAGLHTFQSVLIDLSGVKVADGSAMISLLLLYRVAHRRGCELRIDKSSQEIKSLLRILNVHKLIPMDRSIAGSI